MDEEYISSGFVRDTTSDAPKRATGKGGRRAKLSGDSYTSFTANMAKKRDKKIAKYNREYQELKRLAEKVNDDRAIADNYGNVARSIKAYNKQAARLAKIGVQVLAYDEDVQAKKMEFKKGSSAKALRVPGFLIGPMKMLSAVGRAEAREAKKVNSQIESAIRNAAEEAIGQNPEDRLNEERLDSLELGTIANEAKKAADIKVDTTEPETKDEPAPQPTPEELEAEAARKRAEEEAKAKRKAGVQEGAKKAAERQRKKEEENRQKAQKAKADAKKVASGDMDMFDLAKEIDKTFKYAKTKTKDGRIIAGISCNGKFIVTKEYMKICNIPESDTKKGNAMYQDMKATTYLINTWKRVHGDKAFDEDRRKSFNAFANIVRSSESLADLKTKIDESEDLTQADKARLQKATEGLDDDRYKLLKNGSNALYESVPAKKVVRTDDAFGVAQETATTYSFNPKNNGVNKRGKYGLEVVGPTSLLKDKGIPESEAETGKKVYRALRGSTYLIDTWSQVYGDDALKDDKREDFNKYVDIINSSKSLDDLKAGIATIEGLSDEERTKLQTVVDGLDSAHYTMLKAGATDLLSRVSQKTDSTTLSDERATKIENARNVILPAIQRVARKHDVTVNDDPVQTPDGSVSGPSDDPTKTPDDPVVQTADDNPVQTADNQPQIDVTVDPNSLPGRISILTTELASLIQSKQNLASSGLDVKDQMAQVDVLIAQKLEELNVVLGNGKSMDDPDKGTKDDSTKTSDDPVVHGSDGTGSGPSSGSGNGPTDDPTKTPDDPIVQGPDGQVSGSGSESTDDPDLAPAEKLSEREIADIAWWEQMATALDNPDVVRGAEIRQFEENEGVTLGDYSSQRAKAELESAETRAEVAARKAVEEAREAARRAEEEARRNELIERNRARAAENRANVERINRESAEREAEAKRQQEEAKCREMLETYFGKDFELPVGVSAIKFVENMKENAHNAHAEMVENYEKSKQQGEPQDSTSRSR